MATVSTPANTENPVSCALMAEEHVAVLRVEGRGNFLNSVPLKKFIDQLQNDGQETDIILDLDHCETMDSTFMGVLAATSMGQIRKGRRKLIVANGNGHCLKLLKTLGIATLMEVHECDKTTQHIDNAEDQLEKIENEKLSHTDQICHTLEAHRTLVKADGENEVRFQSVIHYLEKSLETE